MTLTPHEQFKRAHRALLTRWLEESDIGDLDMAKIATKDIKEWLDDDVIDFQPDPELEE